ncbi:Cytochrome c oxidase subunit 4 [Pseudogymnoascus australis]
MFLQRTVIAARRAAVSPAIRRSFSSAIVRQESNKYSVAAKAKPFSEIKDQDDLLPQGAQPGTIATDLEQATGLERVEILGKMEGIDVFDMRPLDSSRTGTPADPIMVKSFGEEQYAGCTGSPADSHVTIWLTMSRERPVERCPECGSVYKMEYVGPQDDGHHDHHHHDDGHDHGYAHPLLEEPKTFADFVKPEYR